MAKTNDPISELASIFGSNIARMVDSFSTIFAAFDKTAAVTAKVADSEEKVVPASQKVVQALESLAVAMQDVLRGLKVTPTALPAQKPAVSAAPDEAGAGGLATLATAAGGAATAITAGISAVQGIISKLSEFVEALNPALMQQFSMALRDLQATVGVAFTPIFSILTTSFRQVAAIILPVMEQLKPVVEQIMSIFAEGLGPRVQMIAALLSALVPVLQAVALVFEYTEALVKPVISVITMILNQLGFALQMVMVSLTPVIIVMKLFEAAMQGMQAVFDAVNTVMKALMDGFMQLVNLALTPINVAFQALKIIIDAFSQIMEIVGIIFKTVIQTVVEAIEAFIKSLFGGMSVKEIMDSLRSVIKKVIEYMLLFIATMAKALGMDNFLKNLIENLKPKQGAHAAQGPASIKSFEQISKDMATAAATAAGGTGADEHKIDLGDIIKQMEDIQKGNSQGIGTVITILNAIKAGIDILAAAKQRVDEVAHDVESTVSNAAHGRGAWAIVNPVGAIVSSARGTR